MTEYRGDEIIIGCRTLVDELAAVVEKTGVRRPVIWLEHELHDTPDELKSTLQGLPMPRFVNRVISRRNCGNACWQPSVRASSSSSFLASTTASRY